VGAPTALCAIDTAQGGVSNRRLIHPARGSANGTLRNPRRAHPTFELGLGPQRLPIVSEPVTTAPHQALYRRYRSQRFGELVGQDHVVKGLRNAVASNTFGHAYLFAGPRGTGKTSTARILAKALNCPNLVDGEPCGTCDSCVAITNGSSFDVFELDAASNNGVDAMRDLIERANLGTPGRTKVYILDEVHMLSRAAEAALLKTLEEPPGHVVFVLATTDPHKVSETIRSRTQQLTFHLIGNDDLDAHLRTVISDAGLSVTDDAIDEALRLGGGSARDTLSALDQIAASGGQATAGVDVNELVEALIDADPGRALAGMAALVANGRDVRTVLDELIARLRDMFLSQQAPELVRLPDRVATQVADQAQRLGATATVRSMETLGMLGVELRHAPDPRLLVDVALIRLTRRDLDTSSAALLERIERLERQLASAGVPISTAPISTAPISTAPISTAPVSTGPSSTDPSSARPAQTGPGSADSQGSSAGSGQSRPVTRPIASSPAGAAASPSGAANAARAALEARRAATSSPNARPAATPSAPTSPAAVAPSASRINDTSAPPAVSSNDSDTSTAEQRSSADALAGSSDVTIDHLVAAWESAVVPKLKPLTRALFKAGRFVDISGGRARYALPTATHRDKCEPHRVEVEATLRAHLNRAIVLELVVQGVTAAPDPSIGAGNRPAATTAEPEESIDMDDLVAAPTEPAISALDRLAAKFPGAQVLDP
jgi:DNA polymerase III subunit gamma/tau